MATNVRVIIGICIICNVDIMTSSKGWTTVKTVVRGILRIGAHVIFKVTISIIVFQRVYEGVGRVLVRIWRPWRETYVIVKIEEQVLSWVYHNNVKHARITLSGTINSYVSWYVYISTLTLKLLFDDHEVNETTLAHELTWYYNRHD